MSASQPTTLPGLIKAVPGDRIAIVLPEQNIRVTYASLAAQVQAVADQLATAGITRGQRVSTALPNGLPTIVTFLAASVAGTAAPLNPAYREEEFRFYLEDTDARVMIVPPDGAEAARAAANGRATLLTVEMSDTGVVTLGGVNGAPKAASQPSMDDTALVLHTSGSTGRPKRVPLSHANLTISAGNVAATYGLTNADVSLCVMPLFHVHGLVASTLATLRTGGTVVVPSKFNPLSFWRTVRDTGVTWYSAVPTIHQMLLSRVSPGSARPAGAENLRFIRSCSASLSPQTMHDLEAAFGAPVLEAYGMTEAAHQMASNPLPPGHRQPGSVGPGTGVKISILDGTGKHLKPGERGEVCIQGPNVIKGYENNPEANANSFFDGWFRTGDQGYIDDRGYLTLVGRLKELINRGGEKISPREIDEVLLTHPKVAEAVCFGFAHPSWGEEVAAAVVLRESASEAELIAHCKSQMADFKCPKKIHITQTIPRTATGKIQRRVVAEAFAKAAS